MNFDGAIDPDGELDIERAQFGANPFSDDDFYISVKTACCKNEVVGWGEPELPLKRVRWHVDTNFDQVDDYVIVYTPRQPQEFDQTVKEYDVFDSSGGITCTGQWTILMSRSRTTECTRPCRRRVSVHLHRFSGMSTRIT